VEIGAKLVCLLVVVAVLAVLAVLVARDGNVRVDGDEQGARDRNKLGNLLPGGLGR